MKKQVIFAVISILLAAIGFSGCKKDNNNSSSIKNTVWTGESNYTGKAPEPISIVFGEDGALTWNELTGEYSGTWKLENGLLTISIGGSVSFKANISSDSTLTNIKSSDMSGRTLNNATLNRSADAVLDNTTWTSNYVTLKFKFNNTVDLYFVTNLTFLGVSYVQKEKSIRFNVNPDFKWFLVTNSTSMKGASSYAPNPAVNIFVVTRQ